MGAALAISVLTAAAIVSFPLWKIVESLIRIANFVTANPQQDTTVTLSSEDRTLLANFHRRRPSVKKEAVSVER